MLSAYVNIRYLAGKVRIRGALVDNNMVHTATGNELRLCSVYLSIKCITLSMYIHLSLTLAVLSQSLSFYLSIYLYLYL